MADPTTVDGRPIEGGSAKPVAVMNPISVTLTGTIPGTVEIANDSGNPVPISGTVDTELPAAAALADATANPTAPAVASYGHGFNGTTWDRLRTAIGDAMAATGLLGFVQMLWNGATFDRWKGDNTGAARVSLYGQSSIPGDTPLAVAYNVSDAYGIDNLFGLVTLNRPFLYNGLNYDRARNNHEVTALASAARTASVNSADLVNYNARGVIVVIDVTALTATGQLAVTLQGKDTLSGQYYTLIVSAAILATGTTVLRVYPGSTTVANLVADSAVPRVWRVSIAALNGVSITYSVGVNYVS